MSCGQSSLDAKALAELLEALKSGKLKLARGNGKGFGGLGGGKGFGGMGMPTGKMKGDPKSTPKLVGVGKNGGLSVDARASKEFAKYAAMGAKPSKNKPNTQVKGVRNMSPTELMIQYKGDPDANARAGTPMYQVNPQYRRSVESAVNKENIPAEYRRRVKDYFESLSPNK